MTPAKVQRNSLHHCAQTTLILSHSVIHLGGTERNYHDRRNDLWCEA